MLLLNTIITLLGFTTLAFGSVIPRDVPEDVPEKTGPELLPLKRDTGNDYDKMCAICWKNYNQCNMTCQGLQACSRSCMLFTCMSVPPQNPKWECNKCCTG